MIDLLVFKPKAIWKKKKEKKMHPLSDFGSPPQPCFQPEDLNLAAWLQKSRGTLLSPLCMFLVLQVLVRETNCKAETSEPQERHQKAVL